MPNLRAGFASTGPAVFRHPLDLKRAEKGLSHRVVPTFSFSTHRHLHLVFLQLNPIDLAGVLLSEDRINSRGKNNHSGFQCGLYPALHLIGLREPLEGSMLTDGAIFVSPCVGLAQ